MAKNVLLEENGVDRIHFYNVATPLVHNAFTVCSLINTQMNRVEARGISICSLQDAFNIAVGKQKAFGRAIKALKRKQNFYKINGKGRSDEFIQRSMKIRNDEDDRIFRSQIAAELRTIDPNTPIKIYVNEGAKFLKKYTFEVPLSYPIAMANKVFKYKSQYRPEAVQEEILFLQAESMPPVA